MSSGPGTPTLDQLNVLVQVVETGSFTAAARRMNRALSVVSYTISNLEAQLGVGLFGRALSRKPQLTEAGEVVLAEARLVLGGVGSLRAKVAGLLQGLEAELHLVLDCGGNGMGAAAVRRLGQDGFKVSVQSSGIRVDGGVTRAV